VRRLDLELHEGDRVALWGPNGSGKTTILRCAAGTLSPTAGEVRIRGWSAGSRRANELTGISLSQERSFHLRLTGHQNLLFFARLRFGWRDAERRVREIEEELEVREIAMMRANACSSGMLQQLGLARALLGDPALVLLDEPTRSLDQAAIDRMWSALERRTSVAVVIATHLREDVERCGRRIDLPR
jgi:ABC-type multidrug transport system ATPase subunit